MSSRPRAAAATLVAVLALAAALAPAACGGDDDSDYKEDFRMVSRDLVSLGSEVGEAIEGASGSTNQELAREFGGFARKLGAIRGELDDLDPPDDLAGKQDELLEAIGDVRVSLEDIADAARRSDVAAARTAAQELVQRSADLRDARRELARAAREL